MEVSRGNGALLLLSASLGVLAVHYSLPRAGPVAEIPGPAARGPLPFGAGEATAKVRVLIGSAPRRRWTVRIDGPYRIAVPGSWRVLGQGVRLGAADVVAERGALRFGGGTFAEERLAIDVVESGTLWVDGRRYRGGLNLVRQPDQRVAAVNRVELEEYVASVVNGEMPAEFPPDARRAQAIVSRSYAMYQIKAVGPGKDFDLYDSARSQVYQGMETTDAQGRRWAVETDESRQAAADTRGIVLLYEGRLFCCFFGAVCGGHTACGQDQFRTAAPPLVGVPCGHCGDGPRSRWRVEVPRAEVVARLTAYLHRAGRDVGPIEQLECDDPADGRLPTVRITGQRGATSITAATLRQEAFSGDAVPSPFFSLATQGERLVLSGRGWGHGAGLCQWGARGMARSGSDCAAILAHYYPGSTLAETR